MFRNNPDSELMPLMMSFNSMPPRQYFMLFCCLLIFFKINFFEKFFLETILVSNRLDPDQARHFVEPGLGPNC